MIAIHAGVEVLPAAKDGVGQPPWRSKQPGLRRRHRRDCLRAARILFILNLSGATGEAVGIPILSWHQSTVLWAKRRMISPSMGSFTVSAASFAESHLTSRCSFCGQPFGMIQRCVSRDVTSMTSVRVLPFNL